MPPILIVYGRGVRSAGVQFANLLNPSFGRTVCRWCAEHGVPALVTSSNRGDHGQIMHALAMQPPQLNFCFHGNNPWASQSQGIDKNYSNILTAANSYWIGVRGFA